MTVIVACHKWGHTALAADTLLSGGLNSYGSKVARLPFGLLGCSGDYRAYQLAVSALRKGPDNIETGKGIEQVIGTLRGAFREAGWSAKADKELPEFESGDFILVSKKGKLWSLDSLQCYVHHPHFVALGSGSHVATGAMEVLYPHCLPGEVVKKAAQAACKHVQSCGGKVQVKVL